MKRKTNHAGLILLFAGIAGLILLMLIKMHKTDETQSEYFMPSNSYRVEFLNSCGLIVKPDPEEQEITIPGAFGDIYSAYNEIQLSQGFDLEKYKGRAAVLYSYSVLNCPGYAENVTANLIVCDGRLIACDISLNEENGFTKALITEDDLPETL